jgi:hypothetical protein
MTSRLFLSAAALLLAAQHASAQTINLSFTPPAPIVQVGDAVEVQLLVIASGLTDIEFSGLDALLDYDPSYLTLLGVDNGLAAEPWLASSFLTDPDGINSSLSDGNALYTAICSPGSPATAPPAGAIVTTFRFLALQETPATTLSLLPSMGSYGVTEVYDYHTAGGTLTGDITTQAVIRIAPEPAGFCYGEPLACPCGNAGGLGEGCANSTGAGAHLTATGTTSVSDDDLVLVATQVPTGQFGVFVVGGGTNNIVFGDGLRCVSPGPTGLHRFNPPNGSSPTGVMSRGPGIVSYSQNFPSGGAIQAGNTYYFQAWFRDPFSGPCGSGFNLSNGLEVTFSF